MLLPENIVRKLMQRSYNLGYSEGVFCNPDPDAVGFDMETSARAVDKCNALLADTLQVIEIKKGQTAS